MLRRNARNICDGVARNTTAASFSLRVGIQAAEVLDGKRHKLTVKLVDAVKDQHKGVRLRYRPAYVPIRVPDRP